MLHAYIDESYSDNGLYFVGILVVTPEVGSKIADGLRKLRIDIQKHGIAADIEFHGHEMFHGLNGWAPLNGQHRRQIGIYNAAMRIVAQSGGRYYFHGLDTLRQKQRYRDSSFPPHIVALQYALERVNTYAASVGKKVTVIADQVPDQMSHENRIATYKKVGTMGYRSSNLAQIELPFQWEESRKHLNLQAVDMATFMKRRSGAHRERNESSRKAVARVWSTIQSCTAHDLVWYP